ncbi:uncharacterized protein LOC125662397 [Ostrea edulis]|uniref:uncharacterized protein LOC125662397 n=1 Tax=Ostrea edulis TaxID=37623 RepID=UPI0024AEBDEB|nr:uncharacterized protein LOC125662397 [Ostrea edulis]
MEKTAQSDTETERVMSYSSLQGNVADVFTSLKEFIVLPEYHDNIRGEVCMSNREDIGIQLDSRKNDLMKTDCAIVVAGETSAGKSSVINLIIGEDILPMDTTTTAYKICRMRYSDKLQIATCDSEGRHIEVTECDDREDMADKLSGLARTKDDKIKYVDVWLPVDILKGNVIIVDTPGIGDKDQEEVADMMMDYIPNALAFVFVVNVANAGGLLSDRLVRILERVRGSLSFDPKYAIFLLNKWDSMKQNPRKSEWFVELKRKLHDAWKDVEHDYILKFAATEVKKDDAYQREFDQFLLILKSIIAKNGNQRIKVYTGFIRSFIEDCNAVVVDKENEAKKETEDDVKMFYKLKKELQDTELKRKEALGSIPQMTDDFLEGTTIALHRYIHSQEFKTQILQDIDKYARFKIGSEIESRIEKKTYRWQKKNIINMFKRDVMGKVAEKIIDIPESLHRITDKVKGFTSPFDVENKIGSTLVSFLAPSGTAIFGSILMTQLSVSRNAAIAVAATGLVGGLVYSGLVALDVLDDVDTTIENAYNARVERLTNGNIKQSLTKAYAEGLNNILQNFLEEDVKEEIDNLERLVAYTGKRVEYFRKQESDLIPLSSEISKIRERLNELENTQVKMD